MPTYTASVSGGLGFGAAVTRSLVTAPQVAACGIGLGASAQTLWSVPATATCGIGFGAAAGQLALHGAPAIAGLNFRSQVRSITQILVGPGDLSQVLGSGYSDRYPFWYAQVPYGTVLLTNGVDPMLRWDSTKGTLEVAGVPAPTTPASLTLNGDTPDTTNHIYAYVRFKDAHGNVSDLSPIGTPVTGFNPVLGATYADLAVPSGLYASKVAGRQVLRNTPGQASTFYIDIDTGDVTSTSLTSATPDAALVTRPAVPLLTAAGAILANVHGFPPSFKSVVAMHQGRAFLAADVVYDEGHVILTAGSTAVTGVGTRWPANFAGRTLFVASPPGEFVIASVDPAAQALVLAAAYTGPTDRAARYGIRAHRTEWRNVYYSPPNQPESWPPTYAISIQEDNDEITGLMQYASFLYILERRNIYRFTFQNDPATDGAVFLTARRGCLNQRLWAQAEDNVFLMDSMGVHSFSGGSSEPISEPIQDLFRDNTLSPLRINWDADQTCWSASYNEVHATVRFFVAMTGDRYPHHALCYNYRQARWWIEQYDRPICASARITLGTVRTMVGTDHNTVLALDVGYYDGLRGTSGTISGTVTAAAPCSLTDAAARLTSSLANVSVTLVTGAAKGLARRIVAVTDGGTRLVTKSPWTTLPTAGDRYEVGACRYKWQAGWFRYAEDVDAQNKRDITVVYQPVPDGVVNLWLYFNHGTTPRVWATSRAGPATVTAGDPDVEFDLSHPSGFGMFRAEGHGEHYIDREIYVSPLLFGAQHGNPVRIYRVALSGVESEGAGGQGGPGQGQGGG